MKFLLTVLILFTVLVTPVHAAPFLEHTHLDWNLTAVPPHNEPVVGNKVARYRLQLEPQIEYKFFRAEAQLNAWAVNTWKPKHMQASTAWKDDDWTVEEIRYTTKFRVEVGPKPLALFMEYYQPINDGWGKGASSFGSYWWLVGISGRVW